MQLRTSVRKSVLVCLLALLPAESGMVWLPAEEVLATETKLTHLFRLSEEFSLAGVAVSINS